MLQTFDFFQLIKARSINMTNQDKIFLGVFFVVILTCIVSLYNIITGPRKVTIDSKHFVCTETQPIGIEAECVAYRKVFVNSRQ